MQRKISMHAPETLIPDHRLLPSRRYRHGIVAGIGSYDGMGMALTSSGLSFLYRDGKVSAGQRKPTHLCL